MHRQHRLHRRAPGEALGPGLGGPPTAGPAREFRIVGYDQPRGCVAAYYREIDPLIPLDHNAVGSGTPASTSVIVRLAPRT